MTVVSKYLDEAIVRYEKLGFSKLALSKGIVSIAVGAYVAHISYPYLTQLIKAANLAPVLSETASTSDDDTSDSDFDSESDDYESAMETNGNVEHKFNRNIFIFYCNKFSIFFLLLPNSSKNWWFDKPLWDDFFWMKTFLNSNPQENIYQTYIWFL